MRPGARTLACLVLLALALPACAGTAADLAGEAAPGLPQAAATATLTATPSGFLSKPVFGPLIGPLLRLLSSATPTATFTASPTATITPTPTPTATRTPLPTFTPLPTATHPPTATPRPTLTPTFTPTPIPPRPAVLFPARDIDGRALDWAYARPSDLVFDKAGQPRRLSAFMAFQLMDRGLHRETLQVFNRDLTVFYLNVQHDFNGSMRPVRLAISGEWGRDVPFENLTSAGSFFVQTVVLPKNSPVSPFTLHAAAAKPYATLEPGLQGAFLSDFLTLLDDLPDEVILLADGPVIPPGEDEPEILFYLQSVPNQAARYGPLVKVEKVGNQTRLGGPTALALALSNYIVTGTSPVDMPLWYAGETLVFLLGR